MKKTRRSVQAAFLAVTLLGVFYFRAHAESWCPLGGVEALGTYLREGNLPCSLAVSNFYVLGAILLAVVLLRRAACAYLCPIGAISEWTSAAAGWLGLRARRVSGMLDRALSAGKYLILAAILAATWQAGELVFRGYCPWYALLGRHGEDITFWAYVVLGVIVLMSAVVTMPFCRWFCPLAAVFNPFSQFGLTRIRRDRENCSACGRCTASCPMAIPVAKLDQVTAARCLACMNCIDACPQASRRTLSWGPPRFLGRAWPRAVLPGLLVACLGVGVAAAYLAPLPSFRKSRGETPARVAGVRLTVRELTCRGRANLLVGFLERDDLDRIPGPTSDRPGYYVLEAWPDPTAATVRIRYDPACADEDLIKRAITEPYFDAVASRWWMSPFRIDGYTPHGLGLEAAGESAIKGPRSLP